MTFAEFQRRHQWAPIRDCPGRFVLRGESETLCFAALCGSDVEAQVFRCDLARDEIWVLRLHDGGILSYRRTDGTWLHTLNTREGLDRKAAQLGIQVA